ncbi:MULTISPECIES: aminotransferase class V-fold PLP-dependent enzyme [unclassified Micromonospora]|uniref:aminotransferase class V-fold PLP-dependent enzyme n=1 Tax=unclassified Micromonospora TaxID=2617518 RepID=UPI00158FE0BD|nr:aminotransferase class V-fold PLP-dependent enzyme [Verrucosispora sp. NA02020]QKW13960.1 aminotransferase class V-fold PLP-dependent enzyme [Verrucosispora sp. NA02020]
MTDPERERLAALRAAVPLLATRAYLFSGGIAPLAEPVRAEMATWVDRWAGDPLTHRADYFGDWGRLRTEFAGLVGAAPAEVAITENTSRATNLALRLLGLPAGSTVLVDDTTYPTMAWAALRHGLRVRLVRRAPDEAAVDAFAALTDPGTSCLAVSHVAALDGYRHDLADLAGLCADRGMRLFVDAAQSTGAVPVDMARDGIDALVSTAMKWLLGPPGIGFLAVREAAAAGTPLDVGYVSARIADSYQLTELPPVPSGAAGTEVGLAALPLLAAATAGIRLVRAAGVDTIADRVTHLVGRVVDGLARRGLTVLTPAQPRWRAGVVAFAVDDAPALAGHLREHGVDVWGYPSGRVRVDPHGFNDDDDIDRLVEGIDAWQTRR